MRRPLSRARLGSSDTIARDSTAISYQRISDGGVRSGQRAEVEVSTQCPLCYSEYLRTSYDSATMNNLLELPDC